MNILSGLWADRMGGATYGIHTTPYKFAKIRRAKAEAMERNPERLLLDFGIGEPSQMPPSAAIEALQVAATHPENQGYADQGCREFLEAASVFMHTVFGVHLDPSTEILHSIGSKAALSILPTCFINPGDYLITTAPGYPVAATHARYYGGQVHSLKLHTANTYLPDLSEIPQSVLNRTKAIVVNYPNNPTGACATQTFFKELVAWAHQHNVVIIQDAAYAALSLNPLSILSIPGAMERTLELHSMSKPFNMTGWRLGWICGNAQLVRAYGDVKDTTDSGQFLAIQKAAIAALAEPSICIHQTQHYQRRLKALANVLQDYGFEVQVPNAGFFLYVPAPKTLTLANGTTHAFESAEQLCHWLIDALGICTVPWDDTTPAIRFSVTFKADTLAEEDAVYAVLRERLSVLRCSHSRSHH